MHIRVAVAAGALEEAARDFRVRIGPSLLYGARKFRLFLDPQVDGARRAFEQARQLVVRCPQQAILLSEVAE